MARMLYLEGACGISGDMLVAALADLGGNRAKVAAALAPLAHEGLRFDFLVGSSYGQAGLRFVTVLPPEAGKDDTPGHAHHHHAHRHLADVTHLLGHLPLSAGARSLAERAFQLVAEAEAKAHGCTIEQVHFHEVGALDSLADIVAAAVLADDLGIAECVVTGLTEGCGTVHCAHGELPVPVPAVLNIAVATALPLRPSAVQGERVTPTGIALAAALRTRSALPPSFCVERVGIGLGERDFGCPNLLRAMVLSVADPAELVQVLEANLDDCTGEVASMAAERLRALGARDVVMVPCLMKKGRPGFLLQVLADAPLLPALTACLFRETTTIGVRSYPVQRTCMTREVVTLSTRYGVVQGKRCAFGELVRVYPEQASVQAVAAAAGVAALDVFRAAEAAAEAMR